MTQRSSSSSGSSSGPSPGSPPGLPPGTPLTHPAALIATWFGTGLLPRLPGTWGSLAALPVAWALSRAFGPLGLVGAVLAAFLIGWWACRVLAARGLGGDPGIIVIDEVAGQWLTLTVAAVDPVSYGLGFALFRFFDILKPWPVSWADRRLTGPLGIMLDDILAGGYAAIGLYAINISFPGLMNVF